MEAKQRSCTLQLTLVVLSAGVVDSIKGYGIQVTHSLHIITQPWWLWGGSALSKWKLNKGHALCMVELLSNKWCTCTLGFQMFIMHTSSKKYTRIWLIFHGKITKFGLALSITEFRGTQPT